MTKRFNRVQDLYKKTIMGDLLKVLAKDEELEELEELEEEDASSIEDLDELASRVKALEP